MALNLSKFTGVPTKISVARKQFYKLLKDERKYKTRKPKWLILKKANYYGSKLPMNYIYFSKPSKKVMRKALAIAIIPKRTRRTKRRRR